MQQHAARLTIGKVERNGERLRIPVAVENLAGHKLPTAYPSRRVWLQLAVHAADGRLLFASGQYDQQGRLVDFQGQPLPSELAGGPIVPHRQTIRSTAEVQLYESIMADAQGQTTFTLLRGASYRKDNRLLPRGWSTDHPDGPATAPVGTEDDESFVGGSDTVVYDVPVADPGSLTIDVSLHYQALSPRLVNELLKFDTPEIRAFQDVCRRTPPQPETLATARVTVPAP